MENVIIGNETKCHNINDNEVNLKNVIDENHEVNDSSPTPTFCFEIQELVRDEQHLQQCAVHTLNNLLQLTEKKVDPTIDRTFHGDHNLLIQGHIYHLNDDIMRKLRTFGTKLEFDMIADNLAHKEQQLLSLNNNIEDKDLTPGTISLWSSLRSNHRTPISGNYSFEVLQAALLNRNVHLEWHNSEKGRGSYDEHGKTFIGYIINEKKPTSIFAPHRLFFDSRHWYAITCIRWVKIMEMDKNVYDHNGPIDSCKAKTFHNDENRFQEYVNEHIVNAQHGWFKVDSGMDEIHEFDSETEVDTYVTELEKETECNVFQAWLDVSQVRMRELGE